MTDLKEENAFQFKSIFERISKKKKKLLIINKKKYLQKVFKGENYVILYSN